MPLVDTSEARRLMEQGTAWRTWGPYLSDRSWGTVREDDSADGNAWKHLTHDQARSRAYRWGEDGIAGISDEDQYLCFAVALWNGKDAIIKERLFGLDNGEGNHGEDVKECYFYVDALPSQASMRMMYKYPHAAFPYDQLVKENAKRGKHEAEYELVDTGVFAEGRYHDVEIEYAKAAADDICIVIRISNRGPEAAVLHVLPQLWFRNTWSWGAERQVTKAKPSLRLGPSGDATTAIHAQHERLGQWVLAAAPGPSGQPQVLFTENDTNTERLFGQRNSSLYVKDGINEAVVHGRTAAVNPQHTGTKAAVQYRIQVAAGATVELRLRLRKDAGDAHHFNDHAAVVATCRGEADAFYASLQPKGLTADVLRVQRQAWAGMIWSKQWFAYGLPAWQRQISPVAEAGAHRRNSNWHHFEARDIISMPDKWEYPWFAAWDLGFHCIALAYVDPAFAKEQLLLMVSERFQHPNGAIAAYEWNFDDVNPPVLARAAWRVFNIERDTWGRSDRQFLEIMFQKLSLNFVWWANRKDASGNNLFGGGFLGLDNIGVFDRSSPLPTGGHLEQADGTSWMAMFALDLAVIAVELSSENSIYRKMAAKYIINFYYIARALNDLMSTGHDLWDAKDGFYYDLLKLPDAIIPLKVRSMVGLIPLFATAVHPREGHDAELSAWFEDFVATRPSLAHLHSESQRPGHEGDQLFSLVDRERLVHLLRRMLDPAEFLSDYGIRGLSKAHEAHPYTFMVGHHGYSVNYVPAESDSGMFGGNSNWRGPIWMPVNYFLITALRRFHRYFGETFTVEHPVGSGQQLHLGAIADDLSQRLVAIFARDQAGRRPVNGGVALFDQDPHWRDLVPFYEYFHGDTGRGVGASHQTGWTGLVAALIQELGGADAVPLAGIKKPFSGEPPKRD